MARADLQWLFDTSRPIIIEDSSWRDKREQVLALPHWFYEPDDEVKAAFAWMRKEGPKPEKIAWEKVRAHIKKDFIAFFWHLCFYKERDPPRRLLLATPTVSQLILAWRFMRLVHEKKPVRLDLLKERQGGFSWELTQIVGWITCFHERQAALQVAQDKETTRKVFRYLRDLHEWLPSELRPAAEYSTRTELVLREKRAERERGNLGLDSSVDVQTAGNDFVGTGQPVQVLHVSEIGKWHEVCDPEVVYTSVVNAIQMLPGTYIFRESTAHGANTYWHAEWKAALLMGKPGWNGHTPLFLPWYLDERNAIKAPPDMQLSGDPESEFGNELEEKRRYGLTNDQLEWRRRTIQKQATATSEVSRGRKVDLFRQEHPANQIEAWLHAFGKWIEAALMDVLRKRIDAEMENGTLRPIFVGDIFPRRELGTDLLYLKEGEDSNEWLRRRRAGDFVLYRLPDWHHDYMVVADVSEGTGGDASCVKVYQRIGSGRDGDRKGRICAEFHGQLGEDELADLMWRLGWFFSVGKGKDRMAAMLVWERTGPGRALGKWLKRGATGDRSDAYPNSRMYRRHVVDDPRFKTEHSLGISTNSSTKPVMLSAWKTLAREGDIQLTPDDLDEVATLVVDDRGHVDTQGRDRFMSSCMYVYAAMFSPVYWGKEEKKEVPLVRDTVAWALAIEENAKKDTRQDMLEQRINALEDP